MICKLIAETAFTHEGDLDYLLEQIRLAQSIGAEYVKFQVLIDIDSVYSDSTDIYRDMKSKMLSPQNWIHAMRFAQEIGLKTLILPIDYKALELAINTEYTNAIEIHSICLNDVLFLDQINHSGTTKKIVLGVGGRTNTDIDFCINYLKSDNLLLMSGFQSFPTKKQDANLGKIRSLRNSYKYPIGYADHTPWNEDDSLMILTSLALGVSYIEKHIIIVKGEERADYYSAVSKLEFMSLRKNIEFYSLIYGNDKLDFLSDKELAYKNRERKIIALRDIKEGESFSCSNIAYSVVDEVTSIEQKEFNTILSKKAKMAIGKGNVINNHHI
jgi:sialic acid synthase SpsE